jgi:hypothetical protein
MKQDDFGYRVRQALNESAARLDDRVLARLRAGRETALARQKVHAEAPVWVPALQGAGSGQSQGPSPWRNRLGWMLPLAALLVGFLAIYQWHHDKSLRDLADIDFAVMMDEAPLDTYADKGFGVLLEQEQPPAPAGRP